MKAKVMELAEKFVNIIRAIIDWFKKIFNGQSRQKEECMKVVYRKGESIDQWIKRMQDKKKVGGRPTKKVE